jgi:hypothetical protein
VRLWLEKGENKEEKVVTFFRDESYVWPKLENNLDTLPEDMAQASQALMADPNAVLFGKFMWMKIMAPQSSCHITTSSKVLFRVRVDVKGVA